MTIDNLLVLIEANLRGVKFKSAKHRKETLASIRELLDDYTHELQDTKKTNARDLSKYVTNMKPGGKGKQLPSVMTPEESRKIDIARGVDPF